MLNAFYNDSDPFCCAWLSNLMDDGLITPGVISDKSIVDLTPDDVRGFVRVHLFAGIGGWDYTLQLVEWPADRPVWTASCPCQPFSVAGRQAGIADKRHLWPEGRRLVAECSPAVVFGEQVASNDGRRWLAGVRADLEALGYGVGCADLCAAGVGAPHIRQRLYWVADSERNTRDARWLADQPREGDGEASTGSHLQLGRCSDPSGVGDSYATGSQGRRIDIGEHTNQRTAWSSGEFIHCADGKARRIEPGIFPLAHGVPNRVGLLRGAGNAIVPQVAAAFIRAFLDSESSLRAVA